MSAKITLGIIFSIVVIFLVIIVIRASYVYYYKPKSSFLYRKLLHEKVSKNATNVTKNVTNVTNVTNIDIPIIWINLDRSLDRKAFMENQLNELSNVRISACDGKNIDNISRGTICGIEYINDLKDLTKFELATSISHIKAALLADERDDEFTLILEDDVDLITSSLWDKKLSDIIKSLPTDWGALQLSRIGKSHHRHKDIMVDFFSGSSKKQKLVNTSGWGGAGYVLSRQGRKRILSHVMLNPDTVYISKTISKLGTNSRGLADNIVFACAKNVYTHRYPLLLVANFESTIGGGPWGSLLHKHELLQAYKYWIKKSEDKDTRTVL